ncbi:Vegetative incompatibility protein HET-E-1 [Beauveria bassiana]|uniref:Vegetative incompatibility protein HET-E-1 n=1 Tax=Beauveria bassiana TaxID=176275 RepID=A0A2N6NE83_BEABA|nr:Vegetative incompatibility protein HET-E-1 [Beauveria bassiana]
MEPAGLAVGVLGLAGLFGASLDAIDRFESWRNFTDESHLVRTLLEGHKLRLRLWGRAVGFVDGDVSASHHEALDDPQICSMIRTHLSDIEKLCTSADGTFLLATGTGAGHTRGAPSLQSRAQPHPSARPESKRQKLKWALRDKAKCTGQAQMLASLVQALHDSVPLDGAKAATQKDVHAWLLGPHIPNGMYEDAVQKRVDGTFDWILTRRLFLDWTSPDFPAGKAKILVVEHLCSTLDPPPAYFFFSSDFETRRDPFVAVRSWLTQVSSHTVAFDLVRDEWESQSSRTASRADVVKVFRKIVQAVPSFTFVMDGLDECAGVGQAWDADDSSVSKFLETIQQAVADTSTRIMIVSRSVPKIRQSIVRNGGATWLDYSLTYDDVRADTERYARSIVDRKLQNKDKNMSTDLSLRLADRCQGQFLWIKLQEPSLRIGRNKKQLEAAIDTSPAALDHLYDRDWQSLLRLQAGESSRAVSLLRWAAFALHSLTVAEITEALLIHDDCDELPADEMPDCIDQDYVDGEILGLCGSLVEIRNVASESSVGLWTVHLAHFYVKEFFAGRMAAGESAFVANKRLRNSHEATQNNILAMKCLRYVNFRGVWPDQHEDASQVLRPFLNYAAGSWYKHAGLSKANDSGRKQREVAVVEEVVRHGRRESTG